jgi:myo-inositol-1(or 4)-monophosphatase
MARPNQQYDIPSDELASIYTFAIQLGKDAGKILLDNLYARRRDEDAATATATTAAAAAAAPSELVMQEKLNAVDIVTETDVQVEEFIHGSIAARYPGHAFVGEEMYSRGSSKEYRVGDDQPTWIVDPLDGTVNFAHGFVMFCVSIALVVNGTPVIGVIYAPLLGQLFSACRGRGAWLNETTRLPLLGRVGVGPIPREAPSKCTFSCEWGKDRRDRPDGNLYRKVDSFVNMASEIGGRGGKGGMVHGVRSLGSATMDLAYVAMGSFDIWWEGGCWEWDVAAGICLVNEAGGLVTTANPPEDWETGKVEDAKLGGRLYLAIRPASDGPDGETARQGQERCVREVWRRVRTLDYDRPGV